jgi:hypothetical protein
MGQCLCLLGANFSDHRPGICETALCANKTKWTRSSSVNYLEQILHGQYSRIQLKKEKHPVPSVMLITSMPFKEYINALDVCMTLVHAIMW